MHVGQYYQSGDLHDQSGDSKVRWPHEVQTYILDEAYRSDGLALDFYKSFLAEDLPSGSDIFHQSGASIALFHHSLPNY